MHYVWSPGGMGLGKWAVAVIRGRFGKAVGNKTMSVTVYLHLGHSYNSRRTASFAKIIGCVVTGPLLQFDLGEERSIAVQRSCHLPGL